MSKSKSGGVTTTEVEVANISKHGLWLHVGGRELYVSFKTFLLGSSVHP